MFPSAFCLHEGCEKCRTASRDLYNIHSDLEHYYIDNNRLPETQKGLILLKPKYITTAPIDPWGNMYYFYNFSSEEKTCYMIWTYGSDGFHGGVREHERDIYQFNESGKCLTTALTPTGAKNAPAG